MAEAALERWRALLAARELPAAVLAAAPVSPFGYDVGLFERKAAEAGGRDTPSNRAAAEALPRGGSVLDVGCGAGAGTMGVAHLAGSAVGVDESPAMLAAFARLTAAAGLLARTVEGRWPGIADQVGAADVVLCHHVLYNVADLEPFVRALTAAAATRVVLECTAAHPLDWLQPYWRRLWHMERPAGPTADDALAALAQLGLEVQVRRWEGQAIDRDADETAAFISRRLGLRPERLGEVHAAIAAEGLSPTRRYVTMWWPGAARVAT